MLWNLFFQPENRNDCLELHAADNMFDLSLFFFFFFIIFFFFNIKLSCIDWRPNNLIAFFFLSLVTRWMSHMWSLTQKTLHSSSSRCTVHKSIDHVFENAQKVVTLYCIFNNIRCLVNRRQKRHSHPNSNRNMMKSVGNILLVAVVLASACSNFTSAAKCSDHLLSMKADDFSEEDGSNYGRYLYIIIYI